MTRPTIPLFKVLMAPSAKDRVAEVLDSGYIGQGPVVDEFEAKLKEVLDSPVDVLTVNSGTSALDLALHLAGVGHGDEVVTTAQTCTATTSAIVNRGAIPVWADIDPRTGLIAPESVAEAIGPKTKAIMAVDWGGAPCNYSALRGFGIPVIEDAAHAFMATRFGGSVADNGIHEAEPIARNGGTFIAWSTQAIKTLTTVDGGLLVCPPEQVERARLLRWFGLDRRSSASFRCAQQIQESGYKYQLSDCLAAVGLANLPVAVQAVEQQRLNSVFYHTVLNGLERVRLPLRDSGSSWWLYTILVDDKPSFEAFMRERGVDVSVVHARNDKHPCFQRVAIKRVPLPGLESFAEHAICIPVGWWLSAEDLAYIAESVRTWATR